MQGLDEMWIIFREFPSGAALMLLLGWCLGLILGKLERFGNARHEERDQLRVLREHQRDEAHYQKLKREGKWGI